MVLSGPSNRTPYNGTRRKLVLAFDVGTTYSGISYSILDPGQIPEIKGVTRFPANEQISGSSKIPTVIYYDKEGNVRAVGAEAVREGIHETASDEGWVKAEWFKLRIRPKSGTPSEASENLPPLPPGKTVIQVLADFMWYLRTCAEAYIKGTYPNGRELWDFVEPDIDYVISHPNGWEGYQQSQIRKAVVLATLIPDTERGHSRVSFVTEGEASLHFTINNGLSANAIQVGEGIIVVDAGGGTIDISAYSKTAETDGGTTTVDLFEEIAIPQCHFYGSVYVSIHARLFLEEYLKDSDYYEDLDYIARCFDKTTKVQFESDDQPQYIRFGGNRDNDPSHNIRFGQLRLSGADVASFFQPSIKCAVDGILGMAANTQKPIKHVVFVGGFSSSDWLVSKVDQALRTSGLRVVHPENYVNKAVCDGAVSFYLNHRVRTRIAKVAYGAFVNPLYNPQDLEHQQRKSTVYQTRDGVKRVPGYFSTILHKNTQISENQKFTLDVVCGIDTRRGRDMKFTQVLSCYKGRDAHPRWLDMNKDNYRPLCTLEADTSFLRRQQPRKNQNGSSGEHWEFHCTFVLWFSATELRAQLVWKEDGEERRGPAKIVYEPNDV